MEQKHWLTRPETIRRLWWIFIAILAATVVAEFFIAHEVHFSVEAIFGFNAWYGFLACAALIIFAKALGLVLKKPDTYYEKRDD
ncbi:MAG: hypothetical protein OEZ08_03300 [Betaproteobacteria bacterium]|nr:hypothetical protein [Betaproteobacteria bacterium]